MLLAAAKSISVFGPSTGDVLVALSPAHIGTSALVTFAAPQRPYTNLPAVRFTIEVAA
jgi:hypothetical protein